VLSGRADPRALSASRDLFGSQFGSQKQKRGRMSYIAANAGPHPATPDCISRRFLGVVFHAGLTAHRQYNPTLKLISKNLH
jgi:hypothetical protein